jgi:hypothetical protein
VLCTYSKLGGKENSATPDAGKETQGLRLEAVEYEVALPNTRAV